MPDWRRARWVTVSWSAAPPAPACDRHRRGDLACDSVVNISVFGLAGVVTAQVLAFALLIGAVAIPGAFLAKTFVERMPVHIHTAILDAAVITGGLVMIFSAL